MSQGRGSIDNRDALDSGMPSGLMLRELVRSGVSFSGRERNCCFVSLQNGKFGNVSVASGLDLPDDGRGVAAMDWDHDGDLDVWLVNRSGPQIRFMQNEQPRNSHFVTLKLVGTESNRDAIGARVEIKMKGEPKSQIQTVRAGDAYLSQSSKWIHFGTGQRDNIEFVKVTWPGRRHEDAQVIRQMQIDKAYQLTQGDSIPKVITLPKLRAAESKSISKSKGDRSTAAKQIASDADGQRILLTVPVPLPKIQIQTLDGIGKSIASEKRATLVNLWATWCQPCLRELSDLSERYDELQSAGISVVALSVDGIDISHALDPQTISAALMEMQASLPFEVARADSNLLDQLQIVHNNLLDLHESLPIPCSFLIDADGRVVAIYKGIVSVEQLIQDARYIDKSSLARRDAALPFAGKWSAAPRNPRLLKLTLDLLKFGDLPAMTEYIERHRTELAEDAAYGILLFNIGQQHSQRGEHQQAVAMYKEALRQRPTMAPAYYNLGVTYAGTRQFSMALICFEQADKHEPGQLDTRVALARTLSNLGRGHEALKVLADTTRIYPKDHALRFEVAITMAELGKLGPAIEKFRNASDSTNESIQKYAGRFKNACESQLNRIEDKSRANDVRRGLDALLSE